MAVDQDTAAAVPAAPSAPIPKRVREEPKPRLFTVGNVLRALVFVALATFLLYYVGPRNIAETTIKVVAAVALTAALWIGANILFDQALLAEGGLPADPAAYVRRVNALLV